MRRIIDWLHSPLRRGEAVLLISVAFLMVFASLSAYVNIAGLSRPSESTPSIQEVWAVVQERFTRYPHQMIWMIASGPFAEEALFRYALLGAFVRAYDEGRIGFAHVVAANVLVALLFAAVHLVNPFVTVTSVLCIQGVVGLMAGFLFIRVSRLQDFRRGHGFFAAFALHAAWNGIGAMILSQLFW